MTSMSTIPLLGALFIFVASMIVDATSPTLIIGTIAALTVWSIACGFAAVLGVQ